MSTGQAEEPDTEKTSLAWGILAIGMGLFIVLQALDIVPAGATNAPTWAGVLGGLVFIAGGAAIVIQALGGAPAATGELPSSAPGWMHAIQHLGVLFIFAAFALIGSWIALGPGERESGMSLGGLEGPAPGLVGRVAFGFGAVISWLCFAGVLASALRRLRRDH